MCANETTMHQPKTMYYMAMYTFISFQRSFVTLSIIKIPTVFSEATIRVGTNLSSLPRLALAVIGTYPPS